MPARPLPPHTMGIPVADPFNDRQEEIIAENEPYNHYQYVEEGNESWAGALPVKQ